jgi:hypothetical protein
MITVKVDDQFWLDYAGDMVKGAVDRRDQAADKLQAYVAWLWPIFTAGTSLGFAFAKLNTDWYVVLLVVVTQIGLLVAYGLCVLVRMPVDSSIVTSSPETIMAAYSRTVYQKRKRLHVALVATGLGVALMGFALTVASFDAPGTKVDTTKTQVQKK